MKSKWAFLETSSDLIKSTQNWVTRTERSSGFRPLIIVLVVIWTFCFLLLLAFREIPVIVYVALGLLICSAALFFFFYIIKALQEPDFCRSEKHIENMQRMALAGQRGKTDTEPSFINIENTQLSSNTVPPVTVVVPIKPALPENK